MSDYVFAFLGRVLPALLLVILVWAAWAAWFTLAEMWRKWFRPAIRQWLFGPRKG